MTPVPLSGDQPRLTRKTRDAAKLMFQCAGQTAAGSWALVTIRQPTRRVYCGPRGPGLVMLEPKRHGQAWVNFTTARALVRHGLAQWEFDGLEPEYDRLKLTAVGERIARST